LPLATAAALVAHAGLKVGPVQSSDVSEPASTDPGSMQMAPPDTVDPVGTVLGQSPPAGYRVNAGMTITLKVAQ
jgi:beta-lactam-binding protein with PASTA domain